jgi:hypothetical protein
VTDCVAVQVIDVPLTHLPPGVRAETFTHADGRKATIYRAPYESDGPLVLTEDGQRVLCYMCAAYVFRWPEGTTQVDVGHGRIGKYMRLRDGITISGNWSPRVLADFGQRWAHSELDKYSR